MAETQNIRMRETISQDKIEARIRELAKEINELYAGTPIVAVCVLKGGVMFFAELLKHVTVGVEMDFIRLASYGSGTESSRNVKLRKDMDMSVEGKHVLLVEDVVDTGHTMAFLFDLLALRGAASVRLAALVDKRERREVDVTVDFAGFAIEEGFIVGYGLDYDEKYRELPAIYTIEG